METHPFEGTNALKEHVRDSSEGDISPDEEGKSHTKASGNAALFLGRTELVRGVADLLMPESVSAGCLLIGEAGSGKSALMRHVLQMRGGQAYVVQVRGSAFAGRTPFGALTFLLSDLDPDSASHPVLILRGLTELIRDRAAGRDVILAVDNAEELDEFSAMVLSQMVLGRSARMIAAFRDFSAAPAEFMGLWREGVLTRVDLGPISAAECARLAEAELRGPISRAAAEDLSGISGGNPSLLLAAVADYRDSGRLRLAESVWILDAERRPSYPRLSAAMGNALAGISHGQRGILEALALSGTLPLTSVLERADNLEVDELQEAGLLELSQAQVPVLSLVNQALGTVLRSQLDTGRRRELMDWLPPDPSVSSPWLSAEFLLSIGKALPAGAAAAAAREANTHRDPKAAIAIIGSDPANLAAPDALLELVRAHINRGDYSAAAEAAASYRSLPAAGSGDLTDASLQILTGLIACRCSAAQGPMNGSGMLSESRASGASAGHPGALDDVERQLAALWARGTVPRAETSALEADLVLARAECRARHGKFKENADFLAGIHARGDQFGRRLRVLAGSWLCESHALGGKTDEALELAGSLWQLMADAPRGMFDDDDGAAAKARILHALMVSGALRAAAELLDEGPGRDLGGTLREVCDGLLHAYAGRPAAATAHLLAALGQLSAADPMGLRQVTASAAAYAAALQGQALRAENLLSTAAKAGGGGAPSWALQRTGKHFSVLADAALGSARAIPDLQLLADGDERRGAHAFSLLAVLASVRLGSTGTVERLLDAACTVEGSFGLLCENYAKGLGNLDAQLLLQAAEAAGLEGHELLAHETGERALEVASGAGDRATVRFIHRNRRMNAQDAESDGEVEDWLRGLTTRERVIARHAAAGTSNKMIAQELSISVRTVEGHLYQIYSKLHVGSRRELARLVASGKPAGGQR